MGAATEMGINSCELMGGTGTEKDIPARLSLWIWVARYKKYVRRILAHVLNLSLIHI